MPTDPTAREKIEDTVENEYSEELQDFLAEAHSQRGKVHCDLSRVLRQPGHNKQELSYLARYADEIPTKADIAEKYGEGRYFLRVFFRDARTAARTSKGETIIIDPDACRPLLRGQRVDNGVRDLPSQGMGPHEMMLMYTQTLQAVMGIVQTAINKSHDGNGATDFNQISARLTDILLANARSNQEIIQQVTRKQLLDQGAIEEEQEEQEENPFIDVVRGLWRVFGEKLLTGGFGFAKMISPTIKDNETFKAMLADPVRFREAYDVLCADVPQDNVDRVLKMLKITVPPVVPTDNGPEIEE